MEINGLIITRSGSEITIFCPDGSLFETTQGAFPERVWNSETMFLSEEYPLWPVHISHAFAPFCVRQLGSDVEYWLQEACSLLYRCGAGGTYHHKPKVQISAPIVAPEKVQGKSKYLSCAKYGDASEGADDQGLVAQYAEQLADMFFRKPQSLSHLRGRWHFKEGAWWQGPGCGFKDHRD